MPMDRQHQSSPPQRKSEGTTVSQKKPVQAESSPVPMQQHLMQLQRTAGNRAVMQWMASRRQTAQRQTQEPDKNQTGLPDGLKAGVEQLSGVSLSDVRVHYNSGKPAQMQALAYAQGTDIHVAPGQEQHLAHEAWHVVQQKQGRVKPTSEVRGNALNDDPVLEREADTMGAKALQAKTAAPVQRVAATAASASVSGHAPMQLRGKNPYAFGGGVTSHHIIPHSVLMDNLHMLDGDDQIAMMGRFLPQFANLTLETLIKASVENNSGESWPVGYNNQNKTLRHVEMDNPAGFQQIARTPFRNLNGEQQGLITFDGVDFQTFSQRYQQLKDGQVQQPTEKETSLLEVFYEWQSGNQFYGPDRYEPGDKDGFDLDAKHVLQDEAYVENLRGIYNRLKPNQGKDPSQVNKADIETALNDLATLRPQNRAVPANNDKDWVRLDSDEKEQLLAKMEGYNRVQASGNQGPRKDHYRVHKGIVRAYLKKKSWKTESKMKTGQWHPAITGLNGGTDVGGIDHPLIGATCQVSVVGGQLRITQGAVTGMEEFVSKEGKRYTFKDLYQPLDVLFERYVEALFELNR